MGTKKIYIIILILVVILFLSVSALAGKCSLPGTEVKTGQPEEVENAVSEESESGETDTILDIGEFEGMEANFDDFNLFMQQNKIVFQVLGNFEEDGDIWICDSDGENLQLKKVTALLETL